MLKQDLVLNKQQWLICHKTKQTQMLQNSESPNNNQT